MDKNNLGIPVAIVIAGALIAFSIYSVSSKNDNTKKVATETDSAYSITMPAVNNNDHLRGSPSAPIKIVEYSDTECPFCKNFHGYMKEIVDIYGKDGTVAWVYRHFPIVSLHKKAPREAEATECVAKLAGEDAFWTYIDSIYTTTTSNDRLPDEALFTLATKVGVNKAALTQCLDSGEFTQAIADSVTEAQEAGARGTPYSVIEVANKVSDDKIVALRSLNEQITGGEEIVIRVDEVTHDKVSVYGAMPVEILKAIIDILNS